MAAPESSGTGPAASETPRFPPAIGGLAHAARDPGRDPGPLVRAAGLIALAVAAAIHNLLLFGGLDLGPWLSLTGVLAIYGLGAWQLDRRLAPPDGSTGWGTYLVAADIVPAAAAVFYTGASRSWLFGAVLVPAVTQVGRGITRTALLSLFGVAAYAGVVGYDAFARSASMDWPQQVDRLVLLLLAGGALVLAAWNARWERDRVAARAGEAERSVADLREDATFLEATRRRAESESVARSEFLSRVGHELRPVLRSLLRSARSLERGARSEVTRANARQIGEGGRHLLDVINEVIDLARVETGSIARELEPVPVLPAIEDVLERAAQAAERRSIRIVTRDLPEPDIEVLANDRKLRQVFANLVSNAVKYNRSPGTIEIRCSSHEDRLRIAVGDTGPGIPADRIEEAFAPFERLGAELTDVRGTGLGLTLSRALVEAMRGRMEVETGPEGGGTTVWFELPLETAGAGDEPDPDDPLARG